MGARMSENAGFRAASDQSLLIYFGQQITREASENVRKLLRLLEREPIPGVRNLHPAYCSLLVKFDPLKLQHSELEGILRACLERMQSMDLPAPRVVDIPVCYGHEFGPDLKEVAALHRMTEAKVVELHTAKEYLVYFLGFVPGFAYLGELPEALVTPRLATPRRIVPPGSVGIAGNQTGVYPFVTPGGWRLLGRTPLAMFQKDREGLSLLAIGDHVRFSPITRERFVELEQQARKRPSSERGAFMPQPKVGSREASAQEMPGGKPA